MEQASTPTENIHQDQAKVTRASSSISDDQDIDEIDVNAIVAMNKRLMEEKVVLESKAKSVDVLTALLEQSQTEAADLRRQKQELLRSRKLISSQSGDSDIGDILLKYNKPSGDTNATEVPLKCAPNDEISLSGLSCSSSWTPADTKNLDDIAAALDNLEVALTQCLETGSGNDEAALLDQLEQLHAIVPVADSSNNQAGQTKESWVEDLLTRFSQLRTKLTTNVRRKTMSLTAMHDEIRKGKSEIKALQQRIGSPSAGLAPEESGNNPVELQRVSGAVSPLPSQSNDSTNPYNRKSFSRPKLQKMDEVQFEPNFSSESRMQLESKVMELERRLEELMNVNHIWDQEYRKLQSVMAQELQQKDNEVAALRWKSNLTEINRKLSEKESIINELRHQMRLMQASLQQQQQRQILTAHDNSITDCNEVSASRQCDMVSKKMYTDQLNYCNVLKEEKKVLLFGNNQLKSELNRLTGILEASDEMAMSRHNDYPRGSPVSSEIELYREQIKCYENDFKAEKEENIQKVNCLEREISKWRNEAKELRTKLITIEQELSEKSRHMKHLVSLQQQRSHIDQQLSAYGAELGSFLPESPESGNGGRDWMASGGNTLGRSYPLPTNLPNDELPYSDPEGSGPVDWKTSNDLLMERGHSPVPRGSSSLTFPPIQNRLVPN